MSIRIMVTLFALLAIAGCRTEEEEERAWARSLDGRVHEIVLSDGTRCAALLWGEGGITCGWREEPGDAIR